MSEVGFYHNGDGDKYVQFGPSKHDDCERCGYFKIVRKVPLDEDMVETLCVTCNPHVDNG